MQRLVRDKGHEVAAMLIEPLLGNSACMMPEPGYLAHLRQLCDQAGILLIFDEVKTGFRIANGGATEVFGVQADLYAFAKAMGNGYPIAAIGGRAEVMDIIAMAQVVHGGTYCGNGVGTAAASAVLEALETTPVLQNIERRGRRLMQGIDDILTEAGVPHILSGHPSMFGLVFEPRAERPKEFRDVIKGNFKMYDMFGAYLRDLGVDVEGDFREPFFLSEAHDDAVIDETLNIVNDAAKLLKQNYRG
jgi:glutamate-1-semialdehyde 2,1-aminomutase